MLILSRLQDERINATNVFLEMTIKEYLAIAQPIIDKNPFQRKRVRSSSTVYSLLKDDLKLGCVIPPLVLALSTDIVDKEINSTVQDNEIIGLINDNSTSLIILDGLQRTNVLIDTEKELLDSQDEEVLSRFYARGLRFEIYFGINKIGILYRMLTLNTGQTPMSLRHQIEILYSDFLDHDLDGIKLIREVDERAAGDDEYDFKNIIEGFTSYVLVDEQNIDRSQLLENIKSLEQISKENKDTDLFRDFLQTFHNFFEKVEELSNNWKYDKDRLEIDLSGAPFGDNIGKIFKKSQSLTGYGAAVGFLKDKNLIESFSDIYDLIEKISFSTNYETSLDNIIFKLDEIRRSAKKIGNAQRLYFYYFFRELFNKESDSYLDISSSIDNAYKKYLLNI